MGGPRKSHNGRFADIVECRKMLVEESPPKEKPALVSTKAGFLEMSMQVPERCPASTHSTDNCKCNCERVTVLSAASPAASRSACDAGAVRARSITSRYSVVTSPVM